MALAPGYRLAVAPTFHVAADWPRRLRARTGTAWREPAAEELSWLAGDAPTADLYLFRLPEHLGEKWWALAEQMQQAAPAAQERFTAFVADIAQFLAFKDLPIPPGAAADLLVSEPNRPFSQLVKPGQRLWGGINLGTEATALVFANLPPEEVPMSEGRICADLPPDYPLVRLLLEPGEGCRFPPGGLLVGGCTLDKKDPDVFLRIQAGEFT